MKRWNEGQENKLSNCCMEIMMQHKYWSTFRIKWLVSLKTWRHATNRTILQWSLVKMVLSRGNWNLHWSSFCWDNDRSWGKQVSVIHSNHIHIGHGSLHLHWHLLNINTIDKNFRDKQQINNSKKMEKVTRGGNWFSNRTPWCKTLQQTDALSKATLYNNTFMC